MIIGHTFLIVQPLKYNIGEDLENKVIESINYKS